MEMVFIIICVPYMTIILRGGYWETRKNGKFWRNQVILVFDLQIDYHRVDLKEGTNQ